MAVDSGMIARIEAAFVAKLATLQYEDNDVFTTVDHWRHQIGIGEAGIASFERFAPFAFVKWRPESPKREGNYDLNQQLVFAVAIGQASAEDGIARVGSASKIGISLMHSLVINLLNGWHPGEGFTCDDFYYDGDTEIVDWPKLCAVEIYFSANYLVTE